MPIRRIVPNLKTTRYDESRTFYTAFLGLDLAMDLDWIMTFSAPTAPTVQLSVLTTDPSGIVPDVSVEVTDVDAMYAKAVELGLEIVYPVCTEPWGVRRFLWPTQTAACSILWAITWHRATHDPVSSCAGLRRSRQPRLGEEVP